MPAKKAKKAKKSLKNPKKLQATKPLAVNAYIKLNDIPTD
jgi:hypothetical protein